MAYIDSTSSEDDIISETDDDSRSILLKDIISDSEDEGIVHSVHSGTSEKERTSNSIERSSTNASKVEYISRKQNSTKNHNKIKRLQLPQDSMDDSENEYDVPQIKVRTDMFSSPDEQSVSKSWRQNDSNNNDSDEISDSDEGEPVRKVKSSKRNIIISSDSEVDTTEKPVETSLHTKVSKNQITVRSDAEVGIGKKGLLNTAAGSETCRNSNNILEKHSPEHDSILLEENNDDETEVVPTHFDRLSISQRVVQSPLKSDKTRISLDFKSRQLLCSTFIDTPMASNTPIKKENGKRLLNRSFDTPRVLKQEKLEIVDIRTPKSAPPFKDAYTPREVPEIILSSSEEDNDIIDISDEESFPKTKMKQPTLVEMFNNGPKKGPTNNLQNSDILEVSPLKYQEQRNMIMRLQHDLAIAEQAMSKINMEHLPDKGQFLKDKHQYLQTMIENETLKLSKMKISKEPVQIPNEKVAPKPISWNELEANAAQVQPITFGKQAMSTYNAQKALTIDRLQQLHGSLKTCPKENDHTEPPRGLTVELMPHQRRALTWLMWREKQKPSGGILADDMGLGKTLTMISLMLKCNEVEKHDDDEENEEENESVKTPKYNGGTLVVCPASLLNQWSRELEVRTKRGIASCELYHGAKREKKPKRLAQHDMVVTTYSIVNNECEKNGAIFRVKWRRVIIDEAHQIRNHKSQTSDAVCRLSAKSRWALTGTPVQNKELDMYALLKFLRCTPFDDLPVWKRWVGDKSTGGTERLHTVISSLMLRRTKAELIEKGGLNSMPERKWELIPVDLTKSERDVYSKILIFSRTLFAQFLHQRAEKNQDARDYDLGNFEDPSGANKEYFLMRQKLLRLNKLKEIKQHEILVLLLRLRQICNHPSLITGMLEEGLELGGDEENLDDREGALDLLDQLNKLTIHDTDQQNTPDVAEGASEEASTLKQVVNNVLSPSDPVFATTRSSSKIDAVIKVLKERVIANDDKAIIVSQWPTFLKLIANHLKQLNVKYDQLDGKVPVIKRMEMVNKLNDPKDNLRILLLSLTAGGVGLNLVGANHLILLDLHWNPQLENQAQDRIYRVGQQKPVYIYKFMATDTIEKRILDLQGKKLDIANAMLTGTVAAARNKLTMEDLKMLFEM